MARYQIQKLIILKMFPIFLVLTSQFEGIREGRVGSHKQNPYVILGCASQ